ncbi:hypothetical protein IAT38_002178 [Cryptococcus sp. DSM 104549]
MFSALLFPLLSALALTSAAPTGPSPALSKRYSGVLIQSFHSGLCLSRYGPRPTDGTPVQTVDCQYADRWDISPGSGSIIVTGTNYALDAGTGTENNEPVKIWTSYPGLFQQTWYYTDDNRIAITGGDQCLDEAYAAGHGGLQTYQCTTGNTNQIFTVIEEAPVTSTAVVSTSSAPATETVVSSSSGPEITVVTSSSGPEVTVVTSSSGPAVTA